MKRILILAMCFLIMCSCAVMVSAEDSGAYENAGQLYDAWMRQGGVPDYISGVWSTDGGSINLTFGVVKGEEGEKGKQEILALIKDDSTVTIVYQTYSRNYLYRIQKEIEETYFENGLGLVAAGVKEKENRLAFWIHVDYADNVDTLAMIRQVTEQYGDVVSFAYVDYYIEHSAGKQPTSTAPVLVMINPQNQMMSFGFAMVMCAIVLASFLLMQMQKRRVMAVAADGSAIALEKSQISQKEIEETIRKTEIQIPESLDHRVMQSVNQ